MKKIFSIVSLMFVLALSSCNADWNFDAESHSNPFSGELLENTRWGEENASELIIGTNTVTINTDNGISLTCNIGSIEKLDDDYYIKITDELNENVIKNTGNWYKSLHYGLIKAEVTKNYIKIINGDESFYLNKE